MSRITLEDVALECTGDVYLDHDVRERAAALCRSAQAVIEAATPLLTAGDWTQLEYAAIARVRLALAAHARIENGHD
jgi:hypothetical protein